MKRGNRTAKGAIDLMEESLFLFRSAPPAAWAAYYLGSLPFVLGLLFFWADMSRSPFASQHMAGAALVLAVLFVWMKFWQAIFARHLRATLAGEAAAKIELRQAMRILLTQSALQPIGLLLLTLASIIVLPFGWVYAFCQNATVLDDGQSAELRPLVKTSLRHALLWPSQNHSCLALLGVFGLFVFLNLCTVCFATPLLFKTVLGLETMFTRGAMAMLNSTFFAAMAGLAYLCLDPVVKSLYTLRCFYGESLRTGEDLQAELRTISAASTAPAIAALACAVFILSPNASAGELSHSESVNLYVSHTSTADPSASVSPDELDRSIQDVIQQRKYTWRSPREKLIEPQTNSDEGVIRRFLRQVGEFFGRVTSRIMNWLDELLRRIFGRNSRPTSHVSGYGWIMAKEMLIYLLVASVLAALGFLAYRIFRGRRPGSKVVQAQPIQAAPDLSDENVGAEQLPEDGWTRLARELLERGEFRLALRAFLLASLAHLAGRNLITLAKFKSNRDYERELLRRAHAFPALRGCFGENVSVFDRIWYGLHEVNAELVNQFAANVEKIRSAA
jgi:hypothetical protein